jgi:hypothetical protein
MAGRAAIAAVLALVALAGCGGSESTPQSASPGGIVELSGVDGLRKAFAADEGTAKLLLVLSPT